ncbi:cytochrome b/b6 domain-containing protein [Rhodoferax sp. BLA1]|uniref:cytochrome b/b6 domain-containing protein n=1 Tax=Rhodoferax sp. BLA1 TaxID=2576062 RepID=UPI0015D3E21F|nr:cytochrome b/b6 domain-containing protein [Rhodoferax sp. BLA1]
MSPGNKPLQPTLIWDFPTRLFHWTLAGSFAVAWLTAESDPWLAVHVFCGYLMLGLVGFRVLWGFAGSHFSRFTSFALSPSRGLAYLKEVVAGRAARYVGHNPTGSLAVYLFLALTLVIGVSGILLLGAQERHGPAAGWFSFAQGDEFQQLHELAAIVMLVLVGVHITGVLMESRVHRENLARSMVDGHKLASPDTPAGQPHKRVAGFVLLLVLGFGGWWFAYALHNQWAALTGQTVVRQVPFVGPTLADNAVWREECGSCHGVFHPSLLPARSWQKMMAEQDQHFGSDLALDEATTSAVLAFMVDNAAEQQATEAAYKIGQSIPPEAAPQRITETPYWIRKHREISAADWANPLVKSKANCAACHTDADAGTFEDGAMQVPQPSTQSRPS